MNMNISFKEKSGFRVSGFNEKSGFRVSGFGETIKVPTASDYNILSNKPSINEVVLIGNRTSGELHLQDEMDAISNVELAELLV